MFEVDESDDSDDRASASDSDSSDSGCSVGTSSGLGIAWAFLLLVGLARRREFI